MTGQQIEQPGNTTFGRVKSALAPWLKWFSTLSLPLKIVVGAVIPAIGSAGAVGMVTKLGAYWFVLYYGIRTPADGLPYVAETAAALSFVLLMSVAVIYVVGYLVMSLLWFATRTPDGAVGRVLVVLRLAYVWMLWFGSSLIALCVVFELFAYNWTFLARFYLSSRGNVFLLSSLLFLLACLERSLGAWKGSAAFAFMSVLSSFALWIPPVYGQFLRTVGHGGGRYCTVHLSGEPFPRKIDGYLVVRTGTALLMFDGKDQTVEIPLEHVLRIEQPTKVYWCLPGNCEPSSSRSSEPVQNRE